MLNDSPPTPHHESLTDALIERNKPSSEKLTEHALSHAWTISAAVLGAAAVMTPAGRRLLPEAKVLLESSKAVEAEVEAVAKPAESILNAFAKRASQARAEQEAQAVLVRAARISPEPIKETPFSDTPFMTGKFDEHGVWVPVREYTELPAETRQHVDALYTDMTPMTKPESVDLFVRKFVPAWHQVEHTAADEMKRLANEESDIILFKRKLDEVAHQRSNGLRNTYSEFARESAETAPRFEVHSFGNEHSDHARDAIMYFDHNQGVVGIRFKDLLRMPGSPDAAEQVGRFGHETTHGLQSFAVFKAAALRSGLSPERIKYSESFWKSFQQHTGSEPSFDFRSRLVDAFERDPSPLSLREQLRADVLAESGKVARMPEKAYHDARDRIEASADFLNQLKTGRGTESIVKDLSQRKYQLVASSEDLPEQLAQVLNSKGELSDARELIGQGLLANIKGENAVRQNYFKTYFTSPVEVEAWLAQMRIKARAAEFDAALIGPK